MKKFKIKQFRSSKSDRIEEKVNLAELLVPEVFFKKRQQVENEVQRLRIKEKLAKARARAQILENVEFVEEHELRGIFNILYISGKPRRRILKHHTVNKIVII